jgi:hypothetical protein
MASLSQFDEFFSGYNPSGGNAEEWHMWCQAFVARCAKKYGTFNRDYLTARAARKASGRLNTNLSKAPVGAIGWWLWGSDDHVAVHVGGSRWMMGSRHVTSRFGGVSRNAGTVSHADFQRAVGLRFLGWSLTNGGSTVSFTVPGPNSDQRQVAGVAVRVRVAPSLTAKVARVESAGAILNVSGFVTDGALANGTQVWFEVAGGWSNAASFTNGSGAGLEDKTVVVVPEVVVPEVVVPDVVPEVVVPDVDAPEEVPVAEPAARVQRSVAIGLASVGAIIVAVLVAFIDWMVA